MADWGDFRTWRDRKLLLKPQFSILWGCPGIADLHFLTVDYSYLEDPLSFAFIFKPLGWTKRALPENEHKIFRLVLISVFSGPKIPSIDHNRANFRLKIIARICVFRKGVNPHAQTFFCTPTRKMTTKMVARDSRLSERLSCTRTSILCQKNHKTLLFLVDISRCPTNVQTIFKLSVKNIHQNWYFFYENFFIFFKCNQMSLKCLEMSFKKKNIKNFLKFADMKISQIS